MSNGIETLRAAVEGTLRKRRFFQLAKDTQIDPASLEAFTNGDDLPVADLHKLTAHIYEGRMILDLRTDTMLAKPADVKSLGVLARTLLKPQEPYDPKNGYSIPNLAPEPQGDRAARIAAFQEKTPGVPGIHGGR